MKQTGKFDGKELQECEACLLLKLRKKPVYWGVIVMSGSNKVTAEPEITLYYSALAAYWYSKTILKFVCEI
jgi:hypothetical protein